MGSTATVDDIATYFPATAAGDVVMVKDAVKDTERHRDGAKVLPSAGGRANSDGRVKMNGGSRTGEAPPLEHSSQHDQLDGPDALRPAKSSRSWCRRGVVKLDVTDDDGPRAIPPMSVVTALRRTVSKSPDHVALADKVNGVWQTITYKQYYDHITCAAKAFIKLGLEPYGAVGILGFNSPEWFISDLAAIFAGGLATGIYATNTPEACRAIAAVAECHIIVVENNHQLQKILKVWDQLPKLHAVVQYKGEPAVGHPDSSRKILSWSEFMKLGIEISDSILDKRIRNLAPNQCCTLIFTSGTTGSAKGVMLSHDNLIWTAQVAGLTFKWQYNCDVMVSYLPLSHVAAQIVDIFIPILYGASIYFAQPDALKGSLGETLKEVRPTAFFGVPRVWEKIQEKMVAVGRSRGVLSRWIVWWAKYIGLSGSLSVMNGGSLPYGWTVADYLVFQSVRRSLGFDRCNFFLASAAPMMKETLDFFHSLNIPIMELYGMSECSGPHTFSTPWQYRLMSVGKEMLGASTRLHNVDKDGNGELCVHGRHIFMGYLDDECQTCDALDEDGWFRTGDIGKQDDDGYLYITGRLKEILITAGGENVAPVPIEDAVKEQLPCVSNCMLVGDRRKFLSILLTMKTTVDPETQEPQDELTAVAVEWFQSVGIEVSTVTEVLNDDDGRIAQCIQDGITRANQRAVSHAQNIQKWRILPRDFSITTGEFGPTMKLKRSVVADIYKKEIDRFYLDSDI
jgi:long-chain-fatty-acid--CoA ligase ACSBG